MVRKAARKVFTLAGVSKAALEGVGEEGEGISAGIRDEKGGMRVLLVFTNICVVWQYGVVVTGKQATSKITVKVKVEKSSTTPGYNHSRASDLCRCELRA